MSTRDILLTLAATSALIVGCKSSPTGSPVPAEPAVVTGRGLTCDAALSIAGQLVQRSFPAGVDLVPVTGDRNAAVVEGGLGFVRDGKYGAALAIVHQGKPVLVPDSSGAVNVLGAIMPGTDLHVLVFSRAKLTPRAEFGGLTLVEPDPTKWTLEVRLLDGAGQIRGQKSLPYAGEAVTPLDIDTTGIAMTTSVLVQLDKRGLVSRFPGDLTDEPVNMQIVEVDFRTGQLNVEPGARESVTSEDFHDLSVALIPPPVCPKSACGTVIHPVGDDAECPACPTGSVCVDNMCRAAASVPGGACVPKTRDGACGNAGNGAGCGRQADGCGGVIDCGGCGRGQSCGASEPGRCGDPTVVRPSDVRAFFGTAVCGCFTDAKDQRVEVSCKEGFRCDVGVCVEEKKP